jgi:hypothetical protein
MYYDPEDHLLEKGGTFVYQPFTPWTSSTGKIIPPPSWKDLGL